MVLHTLFHHMFTEQVFTEIHAFTESHGSLYSVSLCVHRLMCSQRVTWFSVLCSIMCSQGVFTETQCSQSVMWFSILCCIMCSQRLLCSQSHGSPYPVSSCVHGGLWLYTLFLCLSQRVLQLFIRLCIYLERPSDVLPYIDNFFNSCKEGDAGFKVGDVKPSRTRLDVAKVLVARGDTSQARELLLLVTSASHNHSQKEEVSTQVNSFNLFWGRGQKMW